MQKILFLFSLNLILVIVCGQLYWYFATTYIHENEPMKIKYSIGVPEILCLFIIFIGFNIIDFIKNTNWKLVIEIILFLIMVLICLLLDTYEIISFSKAFLIILVMKGGASVYCRSLMNTKS